MKLNQLTGKAAQDRPWVNYLMPQRALVHKTRGANRADRRAKQREVRLELKAIAKTLPRLPEGTKEWFKMDLRKSELELWQSGPQHSVNVPFANPRSAK